MSDDYLPALNGARILGSLHVTLGHLYQSGLLTTLSRYPGFLRFGYFCSWGFTWVPWYMMLSGYVLTHAELKVSLPHLTSPYLT